MKAKKYRLETVLDLRRRARDEAARLVARSLERLDAAEAELARRRRLVQQCFERQNQSQRQMESALDRGIQARDILAHQNYLNDLRRLEAELEEAVDKQIGAVAAAERETEAARENLTEAARQLKAIEIHKTGWQETERAAENRRSQKISDEIGAILHGRGGKS
jgi:flagellar export protein FliJ